MMYYLKCLIVLGLFISLGSCRTSPAEASSAYLLVEGKTMGTYYRIKYADELDRDFKAQFDSLLKAINLEVSTYIPEATISQFNEADTDFSLSYNPKSQAQEAGYANLHFKANYERSRSIYEEMEGYYDPTVMPLINYWGFGYTEKKKVEAVDSILIDSLIQLVGFDQVVLDKESQELRKEKPGVQLDFSSCAKGYAVDALAGLLFENGVEHYMVEIGGEVTVKGVNPSGNAWSIAVSLPRDGSALEEIQAILALNNVAVATSGNYRIFYEVEGEKYAHIINPLTGFTERSNLLSVSVLASDCMIADAYATAFMVMGIEKSLAFAQGKPELEAYFIFSQPDGTMAVTYTDGIPAVLKEL